MRSKGPQQLIAANSICDSITHFEKKTKKKKRIVDCIPALVEIGASDFEGLG